MNNFIKITNIYTGKRFYKYIVTFYDGKKVELQQYNSLNLVNDFLHIIQSDIDTSNDSAIKKLCRLYEKYLKLPENIIAKKVNEDLKILRNTYSNSEITFVKLLEYEAHAIQMFINMQLKLQSNNEKDMKPLNKYRHITSDMYILSAINQEGFNSFARHFIHFFEPDRIKKNIINPKSAKRGHLTHIQFFFTIFIL